MSKALNPFEDKVFRLLTYMGWERVIGGWLRRPGEAKVPDCDVHYALTQEATCNNLLINMCATHPEIKIEQLCKYDGDGAITAWHNRKEYYQAPYKPRDFYEAAVDVLLWCYERLEEEKKDGTV